MEKGRTEFLEIASPVGGEWRVRNRRRDPLLTLYPNGKKAENLSGSLLKFPAARVEFVALVPQGSTPP